ncbi:Hydrogenase maturation protein HypC [Desulfatibacillum alkenivorans DSM 16219]|jgi:hydrogenase expression/formation protein HypC|uniref:Hydrogenase maturation protein HypC n=1 Tax=Desulfatibacillum alkenivorans DSM 16219 TaxID=1121393 RepID=A0A1M6XWD7_9BACT|nr:HypC/HybG/HupF family hydrogenase formation chaperone [Desulfatibacillum alkenivorans]SHL10173.1 Hydrogenase maturation protein HypC [Desulfatibacillum alkenivorans DSM 16219]
MCLAVPAKLIEMDNGMGTVDAGGVRKKISLLLLEDAALGDYILVHAGFGIQKLDEKQAEESLALLREAVTEVEARYKNEQDPM